MPNKMQLGLGGAALHRNDASVLASARCCCLCDCIGNLVTVTLGALASGSAPTTGCDPCAFAAAAYELPLLDSGTTGEGEEAYDWCVWELTEGWPANEDCEISRITFYASTTGGTWTTKTGATFEIAIYDANDEVIAVWTASLTCDELNDLLPGDITLTNSAMQACDSTDATVSISGEGCCTDCLACSSELLVAHDPVLLTVATMVDGTGAEGFRCTRCEEVTFTGLEVPFSTVGGTCEYEYFLDPRPDPTTDPIDDSAFDVMCSAYVVRVNISHFLDGLLAKKSQIQIRIYGSCDAGAGIVDECFLIAEWFSASLDGWFGSFSVPFAAGGSEFCLPNATTPDATLVVPCMTEA